MVCACSVVRVVWSQDVLCVVWRVCCVCVWCFLFGVVRVCLCVVRCVMRIVKSI